MRRIFIDTNKYLDFYRYKKENREVLDKLSFSNCLVICNQVIQEFKRNRVLEIKRLLASVEKKGSSLDNNLCSLEPVGIFADKIKTLNSENSQMISQIKSSFEPLKHEISDMINDDKNDVVFNAFNRIINNDKTLIIEDDDKAYELAIRRNNLGGVPRSDKSGFKSLTICDEYIWESLLLHSKTDLIFVTRDNTYLDNSQILAEEYNQKTGKKIKFVELVSAALKELGAEISEEAVLIEQQEQEDLALLNKLHEVTGIDITNYEKELLVLTDEEEKIVKLRFGLEDGKPRTLEEISQMFGISKESVRRIEAKALRKMRNRCAHGEGGLEEVISL